MAGSLPGLGVAIDAFKRPSKASVVTVPGNPSDDLAVGTLMSILKQAQLEGER